RDLYSFPTRRSSDLRRSIAFFVVMRNGFAQQRQTCGRGVAAQSGLGGAVQCLDNLRGRRKIRFADAQTDDVASLRAQHRRLLEQDRKSTRLNSSHVK